MGRGRRGGGGGGGMFGGSRSKASSAPARRPAASPPATQSSGGGGGMLGGLMSTVGQGMAFGTGSAVAHRAVDAVMGGRSVEVQHTNADGTPYEGGAAAPAAPQQQMQQSDPCQLDKQNFFDCLKATSGDVQACSSLQEMMKSCQLMSSSGGGGGTTFN